MILAILVAIGYIFNAAMSTGGAPKVRGDMTPAQIRAHYISVGKPIPKEWQDAGDTIHQ